MRALTVPPLTTLAAVATRERLLDALDDARAQYDEARELYYYGHIDPDVFAWAEDQLAAATAAFAEVDG